MLQKLNYLLCNFRVSKLLIYSTNNITVQVKHIRLSHSAMSVDVCVWGGALSRILKTEVMKSKFILLFVPSDWGWGGRGEGY